MKAVLRRSEPQRHRDMLELGDVLLDREIPRRHRRGRAGRADGEGVRAARVLHGALAAVLCRATCCSIASGARVPRRHAHRRRARRAAAAEARPAGPDPHAPRRRLQGRLAVNSLRARLFAATLAALALTLALTIAIGAVLTRRQVDRTQVTALARRADDLALQRRANVSYVNQNTLSGQRQDPRRAARAARRVRRRREQVERRQDALRRRRTTSTRTGRSRHAACSCCAPRACARRSGSRSCATSCSRRSRARRSRRRSRS